MADPMLASRNSKRVSSRHKRVFSIWTLVVWSDQHREGRVSILSPLTIFMQDGEREENKRGNGKTRQNQAKTAPKIGLFLGQNLSRFALSATHTGRVLLCRLICNMNFSADVACVVACKT